MSLEGCLLEKTSNGSRSFISGRLTEMHLLFFEFLELEVTSKKVEKNLLFLNKPQLSN